MIVNGYNIKPGADLRLASLQSTNLCGSNIYKTNFRMANLRWVSFQGTNLCKAKLCEADLRGANFYRANLCETKLCEANLYGAVFRGANLCRANLYRANLLVADLRGANLCEANLCEANLYRAILTGANLHGTDIRFVNGNGNEIKTLLTTEYHISYTDEMLAIGCEQHTKKEWLNLSDEVIADMAENALDWWHEWKPKLIDLGVFDGVEQ